MTHFKSQYLLWLLLSALFLLSLTAVTAQDEIEIERIISVAWSNDGTLVAAAGSRRLANDDFVAGVLYVLDMPSQTIRWQAETSAVGYSEPRFSPDGNRLAVARCQIIEVYAAATGELLHTHFADFADPPTCVREINWREDGARYITAAGEDVIVWDAATYDPLYQIRRGEVWDAGFQPGGDLIAVGGSGGIALLPSTLDTRGQPFNTFIISTSYRVAALEWSADGNRIVYTTHAYDVISYHPAELGVYDLSQQTEILHMSLDTETAFGLDWSVNEQQIVTQSADGLVRVWDLETSTLLDEYESVQGQYGINPAFSPYGGVLAYGHPPQDTILSSSEPVSFVVPDPSLDRLQAIAQLCGTPADLAPYPLEAFIAHLDIPPACRADLLAIANAMQAPSRENTHDTP